METPHNTTATIGVVMETLHNTTATVSQGCDGSTPQHNSHNWGCDGNTSQHNSHSQSGPCKAIITLPAGAVAENEALTYIVFQLVAKRPSNMLAQSGTDLHGQMYVRPQ